jgi:three-Cys-motif partner protein
MEPVPTRTADGAEIPGSDGRDVAVNAYVDREQTEAKHFILRRYLQELAFKVLHHWDAIAYIDGFSGPWESQTDDFSDTSFMIAISVLKDAQRRIFEQAGRRCKVKCFFSENDSKVYPQLSASVAPYHQPDEGFEVKTFFGDFEDAVTEIQAFAGNAFPLIFIDPTGWTGYPLAKIKPLFAPAKCEVLINFMYDYINRASGMSDPKTIASLDPILGGPGWSQRLDSALPRGLAVEKLFRETLRSEGNFAYVVSTNIKKSTADRPFFFLAYGTKSRAGLKAFRQAEYDALKLHAKTRATAKERQREERTRTQDLFAEMHIESQGDMVDQIVEVQKLEAADELVKMLKRDGSLTFSTVVDRLLQSYMLRETNVKAICADLAAKCVIQNTWGRGNARPKDDTMVRLQPA